MKKITKMLLPPTIAWKVSKFHQELWHPEVVIVERFYVYSPVENFFFPRRTFLPRKGDRPYQPNYYGIPHKYLDFYPDGTIRIKARAVWRYLVWERLWAEGLLLYWLVIGVFVIIFILACVQGVVKSGETCGGVLEFNTAQCAEERGMTIEEYSQFKKGGINER